jgi:hypothetical protein
MCKFCFQACIGRRDDVSTSLPKKENPKRRMSTAMTMPPENHSDTTDQRRSLHRLPLIQARRLFAFLSLLRPSFGRIVPEVSWYQKVPYCVRGREAHVIINH